MTASVIHLASSRERLAVTPSVVSGSSVKRYASFDDWWLEAEGWGFRCERAPDGIEMTWLRAAFNAGRMTLAQTEGHLEPRPPRRSLHQWLYDVLWAGSSNHKP